jgi:FkbM family methyltransferase
MSSPASKSPDNAGAPLPEDSSSLPLAFRLARWWSVHGPNRGRWRSWEFAARYFGDNRRLRTELDFGATAVVDLSDPISRYPVAYGGMPERALTRAIRAALSEGDTFVDIGANFGYFSLLAAMLVGPGGTVHSFEPQRTPCSLLAESARANGFEWIHPHRIALGEEEGTATIRVPRWSQSGVATLCEDAEWLQGKEAEATEVPLRRLDDVLAEEGVEDVTAIKIDTEGYELPVLRGATDTLEQMRPIVFYEILPDVESSGAGGVTPLLSAMGYVTYLLTDGALEKLTSETRIDEGANGCAIIPGEHPDPVGLLAADED